MKNIRGESIKRKTMVLVVILIITIINMCPIISNADGEVGTGETKEFVEIAFKDQVLYNKMAEQLNGEIESKTDATKTIKMTKENVEGVTSYIVAASDEKIVDMTGIEKFTNLTKLDLCGQQISDISVLKDLTNLTELNLSGNKISDISALKKLKNLTKLSLGHNKISDISALKELINLTELNLGGNQISSISDLQYLTKLTVLDLDHNKISDISGIEKIIDTAKISLKSQEIQGETINNSLNAQLPKIFEQIKELQNKGYAQYDFSYYDCTLNSDEKSVTVKEGTEWAFVLVNNSLGSDRSKLRASVKFTIINKHKPASSEDKGNTKNEEKKQDPTVATGKLPFAGKNTIILLAIILTTIITVILKMKVKKYKGIK